MKVIIADDHPIFREGLIKAIERDGSFELVASSGDGAETFRLIESHRPDLAILDISMPQMSGLEIVKKCRSLNLPTRFIILTMYNEEEYFNEALDLGVLGYILKESAVTELLLAMRTIADGKHFVSPLISHYLVKRMKQMHLFMNQTPSVRTLTPAERQVLKLISENKTSKEIAEELCISFRTVQNHRSNIVNKLGLRGYNKLLEFALENKSNL